MKYWAQRFTEDPGYQGNHILLLSGQSAENFSRTYMSISWKYDSTVNSLPPIFRSVLIFQQNSSILKIGCSFLWISIRSEEGHFAWKLCSPAGPSILIANKMEFELKCFVLVHHCCSYCHSTDDWSLVPDRKSPLCVRCELYILSNA